MLDMEAFKLLMEAFKLDMEAFKSLLDDLDFVLFAKRSLMLAGLRDFFML